MEKILRAIVLLIYAVPYSYGMSNDWYVNGQVFDPLWFWSRTLTPFQRQRPSYDSNGLPIFLPRLKTQEEQVVQHEAGQSPLERLPLEVAQMVMEDLSVRDKQNVALASKKCREQAQFSVTHLSISIKDITEEKLKGIECKFPNIKSLGIRGYGITPKNIELLAQKFPLTESLDLSSSGIKLDGIEMLSRRDVFIYLKGLSLKQNHIGDKGIAILEQAPWAEQLESLDLRETHITAVGIEILSKPPRFPYAFTSLKLLNLRENELGAIGIAVLAKAPFASQLTSLDLQNTSITTEEVRTLFQANVFTNLKVLSLASLARHKRISLWEEEIGDGAIVDLVKSPFAEKLERLNLTGTAITALGVQILSQPNVLTKLKMLALGWTEVKSSGVRALVKAAFANQLEVLDLRYAHITLAEIEMLSRRNVFKSLKELHLGGSKVGDSVIRALAQAPFASQLKALSLSNSGITATGAKILSQPNVFKSLKELVLGSNHIKDQGIVALMNAPFARGLELLDLVNCAITSTGVKNLSRPGIFVALKKLKLSCNTSIKYDAIVALMQAPFAGKLEFLCLSGADIGSKELKRLFESGVALSIWAYASRPEFP